MTNGLLMVNVLLITWKAERYSGVSVLLSQLSFPHLFEGIVPDPLGARTNVKSATTHTTATATIVITRFAIAKGVSIFHPILMSWSILRRG